MQKSMGMLEEVKESIINAYEIKTGLPRDKLSQLMDAETWLNANKAVELKFADAIMFKPDESTIENSFIFSRRAVANSLLDKLKKETPKQSTGPLYERLNLLKHWR